MHNEIGILEALDESCATKLLDYGVSGDGFVTVQKRYRSSLSTWRRCQPPAFGGQLRLYFTIFAAVLRAFKVIATAWLKDFKTLTIHEC